MVEPAARQTRLDVAAHLSARELLVETHDQHPRGLAHQLRRGREHDLPTLDQTDAATGRGRRFGDIARRAFADIACRLTGLDDESDGYDERQRRDDVTTTAGTVPPARSRLRI